MILFCFLFSVESGVVLGYPTAINLTLSKKMEHIDFYAGGPDVIVAVDFQKNLIKKIEDTKIGVDAGIGGWVKIKNPTELGFRIPFEFFYPMKELKVYLELAPGFRIINAFSFEFQGGIGVRFKL